MEIPRAEWFSLFFVVSFYLCFLVFINFFLKMFFPYWLVI